MQKDIKNTFNTLKEPLLKVTNIYLEIKEINDILL